MRRRGGGVEEEGTYRGLGRSGHLAWSIISQITLIGWTWVILISTLYIIKIPRHRERNLNIGKET